MSQLRFDPVFTRREQKLGSYVAAFLWLLSALVLMALIAWSFSANTQVYA